MLRLFYNLNVINLEAKDKQNYHKLQDFGTFFMPTRSNIDVLIREKSKYIYFLFVISRKCIPLQ